MEPLHDHPHCRGVVGLHRDDASWDASTCSHNRARWREGDVAPAFGERVLEQARERALQSDEPCTVDGPLIEA